MAAERLAAMAKMAAMAGPAAVLAAAALANIAEQDAEAEHASPYREQESPVEEGTGENAMPFDAMLALNISENEDEYIVKASLPPGVLPDCVEIKVSGRTVTVCGEIKAEGEKDNPYYPRERRFGQTVNVLAPIDGDKAKSRFENDLLTLFLPKDTAAVAPPPELQPLAAALDSLRDRNPEARRKLVKTLLDYFLRDRDALATPGPRSFDLQSGGNPDILNFLIEQHFNYIISERRGQGSRVPEVDKDKASQLLDAAIATVPKHAAYEDVAELFEKLKHDANHRIMDRVVSAIKEKLQPLEHGSYSQKLEITRWLNAELRRFDIALASPEVGGPAMLAADPAGRGGEGRFQLKGKTKGTDGKYAYFNTQSLAELLDKVEFVDARRREALSEWRQRVSEQQPGEAARV